MSIQIETCKTCTNPANLPFCRKDQRGKVVVGCVDACHAGHYMHPEYAAWYKRPEAKQIRANEKKRLASYK